MSRLFNSAYFQAQILKNQLSVNVSVANNTRIGDNTAAVFDTEATVVQGTTINALAVATATVPPTVAGTYAVSTNDGTLYLANATPAWAVDTTNNNFVFNSSSAAAVAGKAYSSATGVLTAITSRRLASTDTVSILYNCDAGGAVTVASEGRYFNNTLVALPSRLYNVASGVTTGAYTTISPIDGQSQLSTSGTLYFNNATTRWETAPFTSTLASYTTTATHVAHTHTVDTTAPPSATAPTSVPV